MTQPVDLVSQYATKSDLYFGEGRTDYVDVLPANSAARILELGCGNGSTGLLALEAGKCGEYVGVEIFPRIAQIASERLTTVHVANIEEVDLPYPTGHFDALIMSEVLEHLVDPEATLRKIVPLVKPGGLVLASSPNIAHWRIVKEQLFGRFDYQDEGPMDRTHLRWFTPSSFRRMFENVGVHVESIGPLQPLQGKGRIASILIGERWRHLLFTQINLAGRCRAAL
ncbi:MAG: class I SAM-dependent methyltransferase [Erythrobacter sp.]